MWWVIVEFAEDGGEGAGGDDGAGGDIGLSVNDDECDGLEFLKAAKARVKKDDSAG